MIQPSLQIGGGDWAVKETKLLGTNPILNEKLPFEIDVTNATIGTRVNEQGIIEKGPRNLLTFSEDFSNVTYISNDLTIITNNTLSPNDTLTADKIVASTINRECILRIRREYVNQTYSIFAKKAELENLIFRVNVGGIWNNVVFNLSSGNITVNQSPTALIAKVVSLSNGWYRCILTVDLTNVTITSAAPIGIIVSNNTNHIFTGNVGDGLYLWGAQLEQGSVATEYYPTITRTNLARIDYSSGEGVLLIEPQRTNLLLNSDNIPNAILGDSTYILDSSVLTPANTNNAYKFTPSVLNSSLAGAGGDINRLFIQLSNNNATYTNSVYLKSVSGNSFNSAIKVINNASDTEISSTTINVTNEWKRVSTTGLTTGISSGSGVRFAIKSEQAVYIWGAQIEQGPYATSYIPTLGSAVTRNADVISKTGISNLIGQTEGVIFVDCDYVRTDSGVGARKLISLNDGSSNNLIDIFIPSGLNTMFARVRAATESFGSVYTSAVPTGRIKLAYAYKANDYALFINGSLIQAITTDGVFNFSVAPSVIQVGDGEAAGDEFGGRIYQTELFKTRLTNAKLITLTTI